MKKVFTVRFYQKSQTDDETLFEVMWYNMIVGKIIVPTASDKSIEFIASPGVKPYQAKKIASAAYRKFRRDVCVQTAKKRIKLTGEDFVKENPKTKKTKKNIDSKNANNNPKICWTSYCIGSKYVGRYYIPDDNNKDSIELYLKRNIEPSFAVSAIVKFFDKYPVINLGVIKIMTDPVCIDKSMPQTKIASIVSQCLSGKKPVEKTKKIKPVKNDSVKQPISEPVKDVDEYDINPQFKMKMLTLMLGKKQTLDAAKTRAQEIANKQYTGVKLLDTTGRFVCNIYPNISEKIYISKIRELAQMAIGD